METSEVESTRAYYTQAEVAERFHVSSSAVRLWRLDGLIKGKRRGTRWLYPVAEVRRFTEWRATQEVELDTSEDEASQELHHNACEASEVESSAAQDLGHGPSAAGLDEQVKSSEGDATKHELVAAVPSSDEAVQLERMKGRLATVESEKGHLSDHVSTLRGQLENAEERGARELDKLHHIIGELQATMEQVEKTREEERKRTDTMIERRDQRIAEVTQERDSHLEQAKMLVADVDAREEAVQALQAAVSERDEQISDLTFKTDKYQQRAESLATVGGWIRHRWLYGRRRSTSR